jgi:hypothetical protein
MSERALTAHEPGLGILARKRVLNREKVVLFGREIAKEAVSVYPDG